MSKQYQGRNKQQADRVQAKTPHQKIRFQETAVSNPIPSLQRFYADPSTFTPNDTKTLQRTIGNQAVGKLRNSRIQRKLTLGPAGDQYEQEADAVSKQVVKRLQIPHLQAASVETLQRQSGSLLSGGGLNSEVETAVSQARSGGQSLADRVRSPMERAFGADFNNIKIHTNETANTLNRKLSSRAFTSGQDIFFRQGEYDPDSSTGQELLAHELTHTIQQGSAQHQPIQRYTMIPVGEQVANYWQGLNADLRVSDDGNMAVKHINGAPSDTTAYQEFYATPAILQQSANALQQINSAFTIAQGAATLVGTKPNSKWHRWRRNYKILYKADIVNQDLANLGRGDHTFNACSSNTSNFLGVLRSEVANPNWNKPNPPDPNRLEQRRDVILKLGSAIDRERQQINVGEEIGSALLEARQIVTGSDSSGEARTAYNEMWESMRKWISWRYGVNEYAIPNVGEAWAIMRGGEGGRDGMGHFAPVIAQSGHDRVTLENDVSQKAGQVRAQIGDINPHWYVRMFGPVKRHLFSANEDQTFWGEAKAHESDDYGDRPLVGRLGSI